MAILPALALGLFAIAFLIFTAPGWGLARFYAGGDLDRVTHAVLALFLGLLSGSILFCVMRLIHLPGPFPVLAACGLTGALRVVGVPRAGDGVVSLPRLGPADHAAMGGLAVLVAIVVGPVFANVGRIDQGDLSYRAYFFADLFAHMSVVGELEKQTIPTVNPYLSTEALPYYWTYFTFPTVFSMLQPELHVDRGLLLMAFTGAALYTMVWYLVVARPRRIAARLGRGVGDGHRRDQLRRHRAARLPVAARRPVLADPRLQRRRADAVVVGSAERRRAAPPVLVHAAARDRDHRRAARASRPTSSRATPTASAGRCSTACCSAPR